MVTKQQKPAGTPAAFNPENLNECIESSMPQEDQYAVQVSVFDYAGGLGPYFSKLPRELRDQIFSDLLTAGYPQLMGVSRAMNIEGMALVYEKGVYRVNLGYGVNIHRPGFLKKNCTGPIKKVAEKIRSLSIKVKVKDFSSPRSQDEGWLQRVEEFMGFPLMQGTCDIPRCCNTYAKSTFGLFLWNLVLISRGLTEFETVFLHIDTDKFLDCEPEPTMRWEAERILTFRCSSKKYLEPFLWKEIVRSDKDGVQLVFHPRKVREEAVREYHQVSRATDVHTYMSIQMGRFYRDLWISRNTSDRFSHLDANGIQDLLRWSDSSLTSKSDVLESGQSPALQQKRRMYIDFWIGEGT